MWTDLACVAAAAIAFVIIIKMADVWSYFEYLFLLPEYDLSEWEKSCRADRKPKSR